MKKILLKDKLGNKSYTIVDNDNFKILNKFTWYKRKDGYVMRLARKNEDCPQYKGLMLHRVIMKAEKGQQIDHINRDRLDNRRINLRFVTSQQNCWNRKPLSNKKYKGIYWNKFKNKWQSVITKDNKRVFLGYFTSQIEAVKTYNEYAKKLFGKYAFINKITK